MIGHELRHASTLYGVFGLVLGLLFWLHIQAQLTLFMIEADVVRTRGLWPRSLLRAAHRRRPRVLHHLRQSGRT